MTFDLIHWPTDCNLTRYVHHFIKIVIMHNLTLFEAQYVFFSTINTIWTHLVLSQGTLYFLIHHQMVWAMFWCNVLNYSRDQNLLYTVHTHFLESKIHLSHLNSKLGRVVHNTQRNFRNNCGIGLRL